MALCKQDAIKIEERHSGSVRLIDKKKCISCGLCDSVCPEKNLLLVEDFERVSEVVLAKSKDCELVDHSASGGVVSELLISLFETGSIDAAIVAFHDDKAMIYGDIITTAEEVRKHSGSYYHTSAQLKNIDKISKYRSVAVVGLPCHISAVNNLERVLHPSMKIIKIGLFCTTGRMYKGFYNYLKNRIGVDIEQNSIVEYHSRVGNSQEVVIETRDNGIYHFKAEDYKGNTDWFYTQNTCLECRHLFNLEADISVGDAWHKNNGKKIAIVSVNSETGESAFECIKWKVDYEIVNNPVYDLMKSQTYGVGVKVVHDKKRIKQLKMLKLFGALSDNRFILPLMIRIRGRILWGIHSDSKKKTDMYQ